MLNFMFLIMVVSVIGIIIPGVTIHVPIVRPMHVMVFVTIMFIMLMYCLPV
jgi:hypothetical protein